MSKVLQGPEVRYQALEKATLAVVFSARRLRHYFQSFIVVVMTDLPIRKVLQKPDVVGRMVRCDENQIKEAFINGGRGHPPSHLKFFLLVFSKLKEDIK